MHLQAHEQPKTQQINPLIACIGLMTRNFLILTFYQGMLRYLPKQIPQLIYFVWYIYDIYQAEVLR